MYFISYLVTPHFPAYGQENSNAVRMDVVGACAQEKVSPRLHVPFEVEGWCSKRGTVS